MNHDLLKKNQALRKDIPLPLLLCFSLFVTWQMGVIYFSGPSLSVYGRTPLPIDMDRITIFIAAGYLLSIAFMVLLPQYIVWATRLSALTALAAILLFYLPLSKEWLLFLFYVHTFCCVFMIGFENALMVHLFSERSLLRHLLLAYPFANILVALLQNQLFPVPFPLFHGLTVAALILMLLFFFWLPGREWPDFVQKRDGLVCPKKLFGGVYTVSLLGGLLTLFGSAIAETIPHGISVYYLALAGWLLLLFFLWRFFHIHPLRCIVFLIALAALGFITAFASLYLPALSLPSCILLAAGMSALALYPVMQYVMTQEYPSRLISPVIIFMAFLSVLLHSLLIELFRNNLHAMYLTFLLITVAFAIVYLVLEPYLLFSFRHHASLSLKTPDTAPPTESPAQDLSPLAENSFDRLTSQELRLASLILQGYTGSECAAAMNLTLETVKTYRKNLYSKLQIHSKRELFALAQKS